jgi:heme-degrading monooxygenase HmoA
MLRIRRLGRRSEIDGVVFSSSEETLAMPSVWTGNPPYVAVIFTSVLGPDTEGYDETAEEMEMLAAQQPGYLGIDSARDPRSGVGITVSYWRTERDASAWKRVAEHVDAQRRGRDRWYAAYSVHVAAVTRGYSFDRSTAIS